MFLTRRIAAVAMLVLLAACGQVALPSNTAAHVPAAPSGTITAVAVAHPLIPTATANAATIPKLDACALITPAEAAAALGIDAATIQPHAGTSKVASCRFQSARSTPITLIVHQYGDANGASQALQTAFDRAKKQSTFQPVAGVGDAAGMLGQTLAVRTHTMILTLKVAGMKDAAADSAAEQRLARIAIGRLP